MILQELRDYTRTAILQDVPDPQRFSDADIDRYLNDGYQRFVRRTACLIDAGSDAGVVETISGEASYTLDSRVVRVRAVFDSDGRRLSPANALPQRTPGEPTTWQVQPAGMSKLLVLWPTPNAVYTYQLEIARLGEPMVYDEDEPEISDDWHLSLCDWAAYKCLLNVDVNKDDARVMAALLTSWERALTDAKRELVHARTVNFMPAMFSRRG